MAATDSTPPPRVAAHAPVAVTLDRVSLYVERAHARGRSASATGSDAAARLLHDVSARIPAGQLFLVLGGSGSGKSSILHLLALRLPGATYSATGAWRRTLHKDALTAVASPHLLAARPLHLC